MRPLGKTGVELPILSMGVDRPDSNNVLRAAFNSGIIHFDTAHRYQNGRNEEMIGNFFEGKPRSSCFIATKVMFDYPLRDDFEQDLLDKLAVSLNENPDTDIKIVGYTDNTGKVDYNQTLSEKRAKSVYDYMMVDQGVSGRRMEYEGKGVHDPVASNDTPEGRALNRRVEILILANEKMIQDAQQGTLK